MLWGKGRGQRQHLNLIQHANQPRASWGKMTWKKHQQPRTPTWDPDSPWPSPFPAPGNYLWAHGGVATIVCCLHRTQGEVGLMRTPRPLWLGLTALSFACGDGAFISYSSKTPGAEHTYLHTQTHIRHMYGQLKLFNLSKDTKFSRHLSFASKRTCPSWPLNSQAIRCQKRLAAPAGYWSLN